MTHKESESLGESIASNAALLRLFKGQYRNSGDRHSDSLFVRDYIQGLEEKVRATAAASPSPQAWRPIETAPQDTTWRGWILLKVDGWNGATVGRWNKDHPDFKVGWVSQAGMFVEPTHWMPIPPLPDLTATGRKETT